MFEVFHANNPTFGIPIGPQPQWPHEFTLVAEVDCETIDEVFELTNSIEHYWGENKQVQTFGGPFRSTSVGDVVKDVSTQKVYRCEAVGWKELI